MRYLNKQGLSLVEIIIGIAIFGVLAISIIPIFSQSFINIHHSGNRTATLYDVQRTIETDGLNNPNQEILKLQFGSQDIEIPVNVFEVSQSYNDGTSSVSIIIFEADLDNL